MKCFEPIQSVLSGICHLFSMMLQESRKVFMAIYVSPIDLPPNNRKGSTHLDL